MSKEIIEKLDAIEAQTLAKAEEIAAAKVAEAVDAAKGELADKVSALEAKSPRFKPRRFSVRLPSPSVRM